jgi:hypothetical protein
MQSLVFAICLHQACLHVHVFMHTLLPVHLAPVRQSAPSMAECSTIPLIKGHASSTSICILQNHTLQGFLHFGDSPQRNAMLEYMNLVGLCLLNMLCHFKRKCTGRVTSASHTKCLNEHCIMTC